MSDWYQRAAARLRAQPSTVPYPQQPPAYRPMPPQTAQNPHQAPSYSPAPNGVPSPTTRSVTVDNLWEMMGLWKGGKAHQVDAQPCPNCGGNQYYSRAQGARRGPPPAPHCYNCGYNGLFEQGLESSWASPG